MEYINIIVGIGALLVALWALNLQRKEIIKNGKINALIHASALLQERIDYHMKIADDSQTSKEWKERHQQKVNHKLRPLKSSIDMEFINIVSQYDGVLHEDKLKQLLETEKQIKA
jgi:hypothetical protein